MKLLSLSFDHVNLFEDGAFGIDFFAGDKVPAGDESVTLLEKPLYINNVVALAGINASGKTTALRLITLALALFKGGLPCFLPSRQALKIFLLLLLHEGCPVGGRGDTCSRMHIGLSK